MNAKLILSILTALLLVGCGSGSGSSQSSSDSETVYRVSVSVPDVSSLLAVGGTLFTVKDNTGGTVAAAGLPRVWNTYCQNASNELQFFVKTKAAGMPIIENLSKPNASFRSGYGYTDENGVAAINLALGDGYKLVQGANGENSYQPLSSAPCSFNKFSYGEYDYSEEYNETSNGYILACSKRRAGCQRIAIAPGTFVYSYAPGGNSVLAITNLGDVLRHTEEHGWRRAVREGNNYSFPLDYTPPMPTEPTITQFYSSIVMENMTILGQWPDGQLYAYDGTTMSPWFQDRVKPQNEWGLEAQSLALYCGDLFVGYWPRGEVWKRSDGKWSFFSRFFSEPIVRTPFVPYYPDYTNPVSPAFYGQRVTAISNFGESIYFFTSNLRQWYEGIDYSSVMSASLVKEYGEIHKFTNGSCGTTFIPKNKSSQTLDFEITKSKLRISSGGVTIFEADNTSGVVPSEMDILIPGEGVFGNQAKNIVKVAR